MTVSILRSIGALTFDAVIEEHHVLEMELTDHPVETGVSITDHTRMKPKVLSIIAGVGNAQVRDRGDPYGTGSARMGEAFALLTTLQALAEPFEVQTGLALYENMLCVRLEAVQDKDTDQCLLFRAELREIRIVSTQTVVLTTSLAGKQQTPRSGETSQQAAPVTQRGQVQGTTTTGTAASGPSQSAAASIYDAYIR